MTTVLGGLEVFKSLNFKGINFLGIQFHSKKHKPRNCGEDLESSRLAGRWILHVEGGTWEGNDVETISDHTRRGFMSGVHSGPL